MEREFLCEEVKLTTWDSEEMQDVGWFAKLTTFDLAVTLEVTGDGVPDFQSGHSYIVNIQHVSDNKQ